MVDNIDPKLRELDQYFDAQLKQIEGTGSRTKSPGSRSLYLLIARWSLPLLSVVGVLILPFFLLIKIALYSYQVYQLNGWLSLGLGALTALAVLLICGLYLVYRTSGSTNTLSLVLWLATALVVAYCMYSLLYLSSVNSKSEELRSHYRSLHPILRVTLSTVTLADSDLVITDMQRTRADYRRMGLPPRQQSLHYMQSTGYVHAVDVRTKDRAEWKNWITETVFESLGYHTLRHVGSADHLHVALPLND